MTCSRSPWTTTTPTAVKEDRFEVTDSLISKLLIDTVQSPNNRMDLNFSAKIAANDDLQAAMALIRKDMTDLPLSFNNFRD